MDIEQEAKDLCEQCQNGASISDVMEIVGRIAEQAAAAEREACAKACEDFDFNKREEIEPPRTLPRYCAAAIRKRSNVKYTPK